MKTKILILGLTVVIINICCASSVFEPTPFKNWNESSKRVDRVNLWPLFYYQNPNMSVLWPMIDKRDDGHAFRPLYSVYDNGDELNVLWPLSNFDFKHHEYRVANVFYDKPESLFIFPISFFNYYQHKYWMLNTFVSKSEFIFFPLVFYEKNDHWVIIPIAGKGKDWYTVIPPVWTASYNDTNHHWWTFGPLGIHNSVESGRHKFWALFKVIDYEKNKDGSELNLLFLNNYLSDKHFYEINFFYLSRYTKTSKDKEFYFFPITYTYSSSNRNDRFFFPLYFSKKDKKTDYQLLIPFFYKSKSKKENILITPLFGTAYNDDFQKIITPLISFKNSEKENFVNIIGPIYNHYQNAEKNYVRTDIIWPIFNYTQKKDKKSVSMLPLFYKSSSSNDNVLITPVLAWFGDPKIKSVYTPIISRGKSKNGNFINFFGFVFNRYENSNKDYKRTDIIWPVINYKNLHGKRSFRFIPLFYLSKCTNYFKFFSPVVSFGKDKRDKSNFINIAGLIFHHKWQEVKVDNKKITKKSGAIVWPLFEYEFKEYGNYKFSSLFDSFEKRRNVRKRMFYEGAVSDNEMVTQKITKTFIFENFRFGERFASRGLSIPPEIKKEDGGISRAKTMNHKKVWREYSKKNWWRQKYVKMKIPLIFSYDYYQNSYWNFNIMYWLYESKWEAAYKNKPEKINRKILWWLMNYSRRGRAALLDVFPFITYDKIPKEEIKQFSVFWRLFRWREEKEKRMLDVLFVPIRWGNKK